MAKFLTIFNLFAGAASICGLYVTMYQENYKLPLTIIFGITFIVSLYVLFTPGSRIEENVRAKITHYVPPKQMDASSELVIQRGEFAIRGVQPIAVEFYEPFAEEPQVEVINDRGYTEKPPIVVSTTGHQVVFERKTISVPLEKQIFKWVARGVPLKRKS